MGEMRINANAKTLERFDTCVRRIVDTGKFGHLRECPRISTLNELEALENSAMEKFTGDNWALGFMGSNVLASLGSVSDKNFRELLLGRMFHSLRFTELYDRVITGLHAALAVAEARAKDAETTGKMRLIREGIDVCRWIVREEYPPGKPSHREDLLHDLLLLGIRPEQATAAKESGWGSGLFTTSTTELVIRVTAMAPEDKRQPFRYALELLVLARLWGEVFPSVEYARFVERMKPMGLTRENSRFYWPHVLHDSKGKPLEELAGIPPDEVKRLESHSDRLGAIIAKLADTRALLSSATQMMAYVFAAKAGFYDRFGGYVRENEGSRKGNGKNQIFRRAFSENSRGVDSILPLRDSSRPARKNTEKPPSTDAETAGIDPRLEELGAVDELEKAFMKNRAPHLTAGQSFREWRIIMDMD